MPVKQTIVEIFEGQASQTSEAIAVVYKDKHLTYAELNRRANQLARFLRKLDVGPETLVGVFMERSLEMVVSIFGILKAGGAYIPLDPNHPSARIGYMLADGHVSILLTQKSLLKQLPEHQADTFCLDSDWYTIAQENSKNPTHLVGPNNLAYVIYTSGSTGEPKGVMIEHKNVVSLVTGLHQRIYSQYLTGLNVALVSPYVFDASVKQIFAALLLGHSLHIVPEEARLDGRLLIQLYQTHQIDISDGTPAHLNLIANSISNRPRLNVKHFIIGGEALMPKTVRRFYNTFGDVTFKITNIYGPAECCVDSIAYELTREDIEHLTTIPIGTPMPNERIHILNEARELQPLGKPGEICISGDGVGRGYLNRDDLTAEKFIESPFQSGDKLYFTGDIGSYLPDGNILYLGRLDHQVKIRGHRIELGEIEAILSQYANIREAVVMAREYDHGDKRLAAYIVAKQEQSISISQLRDFLSKKLPDYMIPASFTMLDAMPLTPNGKVDRKVLPIPELERSALGSDFRAPSTATEEKLAQIWEQVIGIKRIGINDNFFELGGDSILAIQITSKANQIGLYLTPDQLFHFPTIAQLADIAITTPVIQAEQDVVTGPLPLTPIQHWFFEQNLLASHHWNQAFLLKAPPALDSSLLEKTFYQLLIHHDALRLRFNSENSEWRQMMTFPDKVVPVSKKDLSRLSKAEQKTAVQFTATELQASLNLSEGPLIRVAMFELGSHEFSYLLIIIHHLAVDGVSWRILLEHLEVLYNQLSHNHVIQLPSKTTSYKQWAHQLTEYAQSDKLQQELPFWLAMLEKQPSPMPVDYPLGIDDNTVSSAGVISVSLDVEKTETLLKQVPKAYHTQINDVLLTALVQALTQWTGSSTQLIDLEGHGREAVFEDVDLLRTVGWFTAIFPVFLSIDSTENTGDTLKSIKEQLRRIPNRGIGYGLLRYLNNKTAIAKKMEALPQAELRFKYLGQFDQVLSSTSPFKFTNISCGPTRSLRGHRKHLLVIEGMIIEGQLILTWHYSKNIHRKTTIEKLAQYFMNALGELIHHCQSPAAGGFTPSDFPEADLSQDELDDLMSEISEFEEQGK